MDTSMTRIHCSFFLKIKKISARKKNIFPTKNIKKNSRTIFIPCERRDLSHLTIVKLHTLVHFISEILLTTHKKYTYIFNNFLQTFSKNEQSIMAFLRRQQYFQSKRYPVNSFKTAVQFEIFKSLCIVGV